MMKMKTMQRRVSRFAVLPAALFVMSTAMTAYAPAATAGHGAAWGLGGLLVGSMLTKAHYKDKERQQVYYAQPAAPAVSTTMTPEQKLNQLNKLAAGGYITPAEYKAQRQAIIDSL
jgi:Spy/CpxP family protein refolding chaperone